MRLMLLLKRVTIYNILPNGGKNLEKEKPGRGNASTRLLQTFLKLFFYL